MISKRIGIAPENNNYARLATYIAAAGHERTQTQEVTHEQQYHAPKPYLEQARRIAGNCMRWLSECRLAFSGRAKEQERKSEGILSIDARPDRRHNDELRRNNEHAANAKQIKKSNEKCLVNWCAGCSENDKYEESIFEAVDVQSANNRTKNTKTYHLVISFNPLDEAKLTTEDFKKIEERFAEVLELTEHQRHCGVHKNTSNMHMHIAYNLIHPEKYTIHEPFRDYRKRDALCRELELEYGLTVDNGRDKGKENQQQLKNDKAAIVEAHTGQKSFVGYVQELKEPILAGMQGVKNWQEAHALFAGYGLEIKPHGRGLVIKDRHSKSPSHAMKASALDRSLSMMKLEKVLGKYAPPLDLGQVKEQSRYGAEPLHRGPERGELFKEFQAGIEARKTALTAAKEQEKTTLEAIRAKWAAERSRIERSLVLDARQRRDIIKLMRRRETEEVAKTRLELEKPREDLRKQIPYTSWSAFLQHKAEQGNEMALAVLRSRKELAEPEKEQPKEQGKDWQAHGYQAEQLRIQAKYAGLEADALASHRTAQGKKGLLAVLKMERLAEEERSRAAQAPPLIDGFKTDVDHKGVVLFTLPGGGKVRDTGKELFYTANDKAAQEAALLYAKAKWGKSIAVDKNRIVFVKREKEKVKKNEIQR